MIPVEKYHTALQRHVTERTERGLIYTDFNIFIYR